VVQCSTDIISLNRSIDSRAMIEMLMVGSIVLLVNFWLAGLLCSICIMSLSSVWAHVLQSKVMNVNISTIMSKAVINH